ncbi:hypothetical protein F5144DRAFT_149056 [Chaetomium tenue]|uniref:Uncharacterized protein n=1 Tax=Chaetomium tenue TaxID=1854479 RepID=A0ACB7PJ24_9PEZI|nr:hypothetical protein F5144DRAFT_149056 [Chaetomium globosum]
MPRQAEAERDHRASSIAAAVTKRRPLISLSAADNRSQVLAVPIEARYRGQAPAAQPYESWASDRNRPAFSVPIPSICPDNSVEAGMRQTSCQKRNLRIYKVPTELAQPNSSFPWMCSYITITKKETAAFSPSNNKHNRHIAGMTSLGRYGPRRGRLQTDRPHSRLEGCSIDEAPAIPAIPPSHPPLHDPCYLRRSNLQGSGALINGSRLPPLAVRAPLSSPTNGKLDSQPKMAPSTYPVPLPYP